jgi:hypothetical protein
MKKPTKKYWRIDGYDGDKLRLREEILLSKMSKKRLIKTLECLAAKANLTEKEIIEEYAKKETASSRLSVNVERDSIFTCGEGVINFVAKVIVK